MSKKNNTYNENIKNILFAKILKAIIISTIILLGLLLLGFIAYHQFIFYGYEATYLLAQGIKYNLFWIFIIIWLIDVICVIWFYFKKSLGYIDIMVDSSMQLVEDDDKLIRLPGELKDVQDKMNEVKQNAAKNARLAKEEEQRKNDLIVYLAHDLKTPLTSVIGYITLLHDEKKISDELREKYLGVALNKAERLEDLINEFFEITRFNLSRLTLEPSKVNLSRMLEQTAYEFKPIFAVKNLKCSLNMIPNIEIKCDVDKMERVFDNLLRNAVNYSFQNSTIEITAEKKDTGIYMCFSNHGNTIPKEKLNRIFEQFYRLDISRATKTGGAGLGLAISKKIVELHKGTITASSENEKIEFRIFLPILP